MIKPVSFLFFLYLFAQGAHGQKYVMLDTKMLEPPVYASRISASDKARGYFPVERKDLEKFIDVLQEIAAQLADKHHPATARQYELGCIQFKGVTIRLAAGNRTDYVLTSACGEIKIMMHLCDGKLSNENNAYFIHTWIRYIREGTRQK